jgi:nucleoside-diphosphate-sugar epimerase
MPLWTMKLLGLFIPIMRELSEMMYQFDRPYNFDCSKFITRFNYKPKTNSEALKETIELLKKGN